MKYFLLILPAVEIKMKRIIINIYLPLLIRKYSLLFHFIKLCIFLKKACKVNELCTMDVIV